MKLDKLRHHYKLIIGLIIGGIFLLALAPFCLRQVGAYLVKTDNFQKADVAIVLAGCNGERIQKAAWLYHHKKVKMVLMSGGGVFFGRYYTDYMADYAVQLGVPRKHIISERDSLSTFESAVACKPVLRSQHIKTAVLVTSYYHTRRAYAIFEKILKGSGVHLYVIGASDEVDYKNWWKHHEMAEKVLQEWCKTIVYFFQYKV